MAFRIDCRVAGSPNENGSRPLGRGAGPSANSARSIDDDHRCGRDLQTIMTRRPPGRSPARRGEPCDGSAKNIVPNRLMRRQSTPRESDEIARPPPQTWRVQSSALVMPCTLDHRLGRSTPESASATAIRAASRALPGAGPNIKDVTWRSKSNVAQGCIMQVKLGVVVDALSRAPAVWHSRLRSSAGRRRCEILFEAVS